jgi:tetratricopeptide (TPR) repeat protein
LQRTSSRVRAMKRCRRLAPSLALVTLLATCTVGCHPLDDLRARLQMKKGNRAYLRGEFAAAVACYDAALRFAPGSMSSHLDRAYSEEALFRTASEPAERKRLAAEAVHSFRAYLTARAASRGRLPAGSPDAQQVEARILSLLVDSQETDAAIAELHRRIERDPRDLSAYETLGQLQSERGAREQARQTYRDAIVALPNAAEPYYDLGAFLWQSSYRDAEMPAAQRDSIVDEGLRALTRADELHPRNPETLVYMNLLALEKAKCAKSDAERLALEAQAKAYRDSAQALRRTTAAPAQR